MTQPLPTKSVVDPRAKPSKEVNFTIFQGRFHLQRHLGKGGFGDVYGGVNVANGEPIAVKMEPSTSAHSFLFHEARVMQEIQKNATSDGLPMIAMLKYFGQEQNYRMLIMARQGPSLEDLMEKHRRFSLRTTVMLAVQMLSRIEYVHRAGYVHRDLKPDNFLLGVGRQESRLFLIDFGLSCTFLDSSGNHRPRQAGKSFVGTSRYASMNTHQGFSQSRRDDIEMMVYIMVYMYRGCLPWSGLPIKDRDEKERRTGQLKMRLTPEEICTNCPEEFVHLLYYARNMSYDEEPKYEMCSALLKGILEAARPGEGIDNVFDWMPQKQAAQEPPLSPPQRPIPLQNLAPIMGVDRVGNEINNQGGVGPMLKSDAVAEGMFSGFGSGAMSQDIRSLGDRN